MMTLAGEPALPTTASPVRAQSGWFQPTAPPTSDPLFIRDLLGNLRAPLGVTRTGAGFAVAPTEYVTLGGPNPGNQLPLAAYLPALTPADLGDASFLAAHRVRFPYLTGAMANGIASVELVEAMGRAGLLGSFGAAGLSQERAAQSIDRLQQSLGETPFAVNLIHSPNEPSHEAAITELLLRKKVRLVEASAYLDLTPAVVKYRLAGLIRGSDGQVIATNRIIAKVSRVEVATRFLAPAPAKIVQDLLNQNAITAEQAEMAKAVLMCDDLTAEADSGGHTDNRPAITLLPTLLALRDRLQRQYGFAAPVRVGLAGGIATPASVTGAFSMGAAYVSTGSVNQACVESGSSDLVRKMLAEAGPADIAMAPAADMFEMGVKVQVLKRGTMFAMRAGKLYEIYRQYPSWDAVPPTERAQVEKNLLRASFAEIWTQTREFFLLRDPTQVPRADADPKHQMALVFRWYLGLSSRWANNGEPTRQLDYQVWCGPSMGAFNEWVRGSILENPTNRTVVGVALNLLYGACLHNRQQALRQQGVELPADFFPFEPLPRDEVERRLQ